VIWSARPDQINNMKIILGSKVIIQYSTGGKFSCVIVSHLNADPMLNKISDHSPLGNVLIGRQVGDIVKFLTPSGKKEAKILSVRG